MNNSEQQVIISESDLEKQSLLNNNNERLSYAVNGGINGGSNGNYGSTSDQVIIIGTHNYNNNQASVECKNTKYVDKAKSLFLNNLFCKIVLVFICAAAIYSLIVIKCDGIHFDGCRST